MAAISSRMFAGLAWEGFEPGLVRGEGRWRNCGRGNWWENRRRWVEDFRPLQGPPTQPSHRRAIAAFCPTSVRDPWISLRRPPFGESSTLTTLAMAVKLVAAAASHPVVCPQVCSPDSSTLDSLNPPRLPCLTPKPLSCLHRRKRRWDLSHPKICKSCLQCEFTNFGSDNDDNN